MGFLECVIMHCFKSLRIWGLQTTWLSQQELPQKPLLGAGLKVSISLTLTSFTEAFGRMIASARMSLCILADTTFQSMLNVFRFTNRVPRITHLMLEQQLCFFGIMLSESPYQINYVIALHHVNWQQLFATPNIARRSRNLFDVLESQTLLLTCACYLFNSSRLVPKHVFDCGWSLVMGFLVHAATTLWNCQAHYPSKKTCICACTQQRIDGELEPNLAKTYIILWLATDQSIILSCTESCTWATYFLSPLYPSEHCHISDFVSKLQQHICTAALYFMRGACARIPMLNPVSDCFSVW